MNEEIAIRVTNLFKEYDGNVAVNRISFNVTSGKTYALIGGNGAGKTTTLGMLLGLIIPTSGDIEILGNSMLRHRYRVLPYLNFTSPYVDLPHRLKVKEILTIYARLYNVANAKKVINEYSEWFDLSGLLDRSFGSLSAGQRTRVSFAKALLNRPKVLIMDEPTASLDPDTADRVRRYLLDYQHTNSATILLASHNMVEVERLADYCFVLKQGEIVAADTPVNLIRRYGRDNLEQVFLTISRGEVA